MSLRQEFLKLLSDKECQNLIISNSEVILDNFCDDALVKSIPILSNLTNAGKAILSFRDRYLIRKIGIFLYQLESLDSYTIENFFSKLESDSYRNKIGEKILILLDSADDDEKAKITGELFKRFVSKKMSKDTFDLICETVNKTFFFNLHLFRHGHINPNIMLDIGPLFLPFRMVKLELEYIKHDPHAVFGEQIKQDHIKQTYTPTIWGKELITILNDLYD